MLEEMPKAEIADIAHVLKARKNSYPGMVLFLGSRAGGLFGNENFYESMRGYSTRNFTSLTPEEQFTECYKILREGLFSEKEIHSILTQSLKETLPTEADICLAELIKQDFFETIISTNIDGILEKVLEVIGMKEPHDFEILIPERSFFPKVVNSDGRFSCKVIKVFGDLSSRIYNIVNRELHFDKIQGLKIYLENILSRDVLVVGFDPIWDAEMFRVFTQQQSSLWFITEGKVSTKHPFVSKVEPGKQIKFIEKFGSSKDFLEALHWSIHGRMPSKYSLIHKIPLESIPPLKPIEEAKNGSTTSLVSEPDDKSEAFPRKSETILQHNASSSRKIPLVDVLIVTVTEIEAKAVLSLYPMSQVYYINEGVYYELGEIGGSIVFMVQSTDMGSDGLGGSRFTVEGGIRELSPAAVIMIGIAFGIDAERQHLGDIIVSRQLIAYEHQRIGSDSTGKAAIQGRGVHISAPIRMLNRFRAGLKTWSDELPNVHFGPILSGTKLIDNQDFRDQLRQREGEAIGGEMEGVGLYEAAQRCNVDWLLVKAICDWADGSKGEDKDNRQKEAARNAAEFTFHVIKQGGFRNLHPSS